MAVFDRDIERRRLRGFEQYSSKGGVMGDEMVNQTVMYLGDGLIRGLMYLGIGLSALFLLCGLISKPSPPENPGQKTE
jgi:hypothetical protein